MRLLIFCLVNMVFLLGFWFLTEAPVPQGHQALISSISEVRRLVAKKDREGVAQAQRRMVSADSTKLVMPEVYQGIDAMLSNPKSRDADTWTRLDTLLEQETERFGQAEQTMVVKTVEQSNRLKWSVLFLGAVNCGLFGVLEFQKKRDGHQLRSELVQNQKHEELVKNNEELSLALFRASRENRRLTAENVSLRKEEDICGLTKVPRTKVMLSRSLQLLNTDLGRTPIGVAYMDLDKFKSINDSFSHGVGDAVLAHFATLVKDNLRQGKDFLFRPGGEEFVIFFSDCTFDDLKSAMTRLLETVMATPFYFEWEGEKRLLRSFVKEDANCSLSFSGGFCEITESPLFEQTKRKVLEARNTPVVDEAVIQNALSELRDDVMRIADERAKDAKNSGRMKVVGPPNEAQVRADQNNHYPNHRGQTA